MDAKTLTKTKTQEIRLENGRAQIEHHGGVGKVATKMGYANPSFLVQIFGPRPTRALTEKTARRMEDALHLQHGALDVEGAATIAPVMTPPSVTATPIGQFDADMIASVILMVGNVAHAESVDLLPNRYANVAAMALTDCIERKSEPRESYVRSLVRLLKG